MEKRDLKDLWLSDATAAFQSDINIKLHTLVPCVGLRVDIFEIKDV